MKKLYDITFTVELSDKQYHRLCEAEDRADEDAENFPLWDTGLVAMRYLHTMYGVKAKLNMWTFGRNADDLNACEAAEGCASCYHESEWEPA